MTEEISETKFIRIFGSENYFKLLNTIFQLVRTSKEFNSIKPNCISLTVFDFIENIDGFQTKSIIIESSFKKIAISDKDYMYDFGILSIKFSNEAMPDEALDRYNEISKLKKDIQND